jgi:hypothetical protein
MAIRNAIRSAVKPSLPQTLGQIIRTQLANAHRFDITDGARINKPRGRPSGTKKPVETREPVRIDRLIEAAIGRLEGLRRESTGDRSRLLIGGYTQDEIDASLQSHTALAAAIRLIAKREGKAERTIRNYYEKCSANRRALRA